MGLTALSAEAWLDPAPDLAARVAGFAAFPEGVQRSPEGEAPGRELARMLGIDGGLADAALAHHEDMCLLTRRTDEPFYRLVGTAVAFPTDWIPARKMGLSLTAMHAPSSQQLPSSPWQMSPGATPCLKSTEPGPNRRT